MNLTPCGGRVLVCVEESIDLDNRSVGFGSHGTAVLQVNQPLQFQARVVRRATGASILDISSEGIKKWEPSYKEGDLILIHIESYAGFQLIRFREHWNKPVEKGEVLLVPAPAILGVIE